MACVGLRRVGVGPCPIYSPTWITVLMTALALRDTTAALPCQTVVSDGLCFRVGNTRMTWQQANTTCITSGGRLLSVKSAAQKAVISDFAASNNIDALWTGGKVFEHDWVWVGLRQRHIQYLGCYGDQRRNRDLQKGLVVDTVILPSQCAQRCMGENSDYRVASVQRNSNNDVVCRCGREYGRHGVRTDRACERPCPNSPTSTSYVDKDRVNLDRFCGNRGRQIVVRIQGLPFHSWVGPTYQGQGECAALDHQESFRWQAFHCNDDKLSHICEYDRTQYNCITTNNMIWINKAVPPEGICITIHTNSQNWYSAKSDCQTRGGYLLEVPDHVVQNKLEDLLPGTGENYWLGLTRRIWKWRDDTVVDGFTDWLPNRPYNPGRNAPSCIIMTTPGYKWDSVDCNCDYPFICQYQATPPGIPATSDSPSTTIPGPSPTPSVQDPGTNNNGTTGEQQENLTVIIGGSVGGSILLLIIISIIIGCCCCKKKLSRRVTMKLAVGRTRNNSPPVPPRRGHTNPALTPPHRKPKSTQHKNTENYSTEPNRNVYYQKRIEGGEKVKKKGGEDGNDDYLVMRSPGGQRSDVYEELDGEPKYEESKYEKLSGKRDVQVSGERYEQLVGAVSNSGGYMDMGAGRPQYDNALPVRRDPSPYSHYLKPIN